MKKLLAGLAIATALGVAGIAVAGAVSTTTTTSKAAPEKQSKHHGLRGLSALAAQTAASTIGVDVKTLRAEVKSGHTIAQVAQQHHVAPATVVRAITTKLNATIDAAVKAGKLSKERAAKLKQRVPALADHIVNHTNEKPGSARRDKPKRKYHSRDTLDAAAKAIGVTPDTLRGAMAKGQTIASVAKAHNVSPDKVVTPMVAAAQRNFDATTKHRKGSDRDYRAQIPKIMRKLVNGEWKSHNERRAPAHK